MSASSGSPQNPPPPPSSSSAAAVTVAFTPITASPVPQPPPPRPPPSSSNRRPPPPCWTHDETLALIESYRDKWHSLRRGNLRAADWQSVADSVAKRCGQDPPSKTSIQCRHKVEKLRKRYRAEKQKRPTNSSWVYFRLMDSMEIGPSPSPSAVARTPISSPDSSSSDDDDESDDNRGFNGSLRQFMSNRGSGDGGNIGLRFKIPTAARSKMVPPSDPGPPPKNHQQPRVFVGSDSPSPPPLSRPPKRSGGGGFGRDEEVAELVAAMKMLTDGYVRMERMKMETAKEMEKRRMEMELERTRLILEAQRGIIESVVGRFKSDGGSSGERKRIKGETPRQS
ncbi:hypothetical protein QJS04_geneDACA012539 [Acorus gramineus]|uniref:Myb-like domain-containing protein n=1 Tax=Acorus gramineus TaxID=55184 RepID=A0AAV9BAQ4_ACOGR|nr:hypothetical protein QJS04_geneDACA012539 [Acorus gramineus]